MISAFDEWTPTGGPETEPLPLQRYFESPTGYVLGVVVWPLYLAVWYGSVYVTEILGVLPFTLSIIIAVGGLFFTSVVSAAAIGVTAWQVPEARLRGHFARLSLFVLLAPALFYLYFVSSFASISGSGLGAFAQHAIVTTGLLGPMLGFSFLAFALFVLGVRYSRE